MKKNIYSLLNETNMNINEYDDSPLSDEEVKNIMKRFNNEENKTVIPKKSSKKSVIFGIAAAAACFAGVIGVSVNMTGDEIQQNSSMVAIARSEEKKENSFFLVADAAESEGEFNKNWLTFENTGGMIPYSGRVFFIGGNNIKTVDLSIDKGSLYKANFSKMRLEKDGEIVETSDSCEYIGNDYSEDYNADRCFGFYFPEEVYENHVNEIGEDGPSVWHACYDDFNNGKLTVSVTYNDGSTESTEYRLTSGKLEINPDTMKPNGNIINGDKPYIYGLLMEKEN